MVQETAQRPMEEHKKNVTIRDVARKAGVSIATVSYALNGKTGRFSAETLDTIRTVMDELGYEPDFTARSLARGKNMLLGLMLPLTGPLSSPNYLLRDNPFYNEFTDAIMEVAGERGYDIIVRGLSSADESLPWIQKRRPDGIIYLGFFPDVEERKLVQSGMPVVLVDTKPDVNPRFPRVCTDEYAAARCAVDSLIAHGHRRIALLSGKVEENYINSQRRRAYVDSLSDAGVHADESLIVDSTISFDGGYRGGLALLERGLDCTAAFCMADIMALGLMSCMREHDVAVPGRLSVMGYDDIGLCRYFVPSLSTVRQDIRMKGMEAARMLIAEIEDGARSPGPRVIPHSLQLRKTVSRI